MYFSVLSWFAILRASRKTSITTTLRKSSLARRILTYSSGSSIYCPSCNSGLRWYLMNLYRKKYPWYKIMTSKLSYKSRLSQSLIKSNSRLFAKIGFVPFLWRRERTSRKMMHSSLWNCFNFILNQQTS